MATENHRQTLLREMGVQSWFARGQLPGAGPSHEIALVTEAPVVPTFGDAARQVLSDDHARGPGQPVPDPRQRSLPENAQPKSAQPNSTQPASVEHGPASLKAVLGQELAKAPERQPVDVHKQADTQTHTGQDGAAPPAVEDDQTLDFAFSWFNVGKRLSVLAMLPAGADCLTTDTGQMLQRILVALNPALKDAVAQEHTFHWPFPGDLGLPVGQRAARQAVDGFVARRLREQPSAMLLILADETPPFLYRDTRAGEDEQAGSLLVHPQFGFAMLRTHSLHAMQTNADLKRSAWQAMQLVRDRLKRGEE